MEQVTALPRRPPAPRRLGLVSGRHGFQRTGPVTVADLPHYGPVRWVVDLVSARGIDPPAIDKVGCHKHSCFLQIIPSFHQTSGLTSGQHIMTLLTCQDSRVSSENMERGLDSTAEPR